jgi:hypothetical protein
MARRKGPDGCRAISAIAPWLSAWALEWPLYAISSANPAKTR